MKESEATEFVKRQRDISQFEVYSVDERTTDDRYLCAGLKHFYIEFLFCDFAKLTLSVFNLAMTSNIHYQLC